MTSLTPDAAQRAVRWPARLMMFAGMVNSVCLLFLLLYFASWQAPDNASGKESTLIVFSGLFLAALLVVFGAIRMRRLESRDLCLVAAVLCLLIGPAYPIGVPAGIWALIVLGREEIRAAFAARSKSGNSRTGNADSTAPESAGREIARFICVSLIALLGTLLPCVFWTAASSSDFASWTIDPGTRIAIFIGFIVSVVGLGMLFRYGFSFGRRRITESQISQWKNRMRSPGNWIGTSVSVLALMIMGIDVSGPFYEQVIESLVRPLSGLALATLAAIAIMRAIRNSNSGESTDSISPFGWPVGFAAIILPAVLLWSQWSRNQGYIHFVTDSQDSLIRLWPMGKQDIGPSYGRVSTFRVPAGRYEWSVSEHGLIGDRIEHGVIDVEPQRTHPITARVLGDEIAERVSGRWKCRTYAIDWSAATNSTQPVEIVKYVASEDERKNASLPPWTRRPEWVDIENGVAVFHYISEPTELTFGLSLEADRSPKLLSLVPHPHTQTIRKPADVVFGAWAVGRSTLVMRLQPSSRSYPRHFNSRDTQPTQIELRFEKPDDFTLFQGEWKLTNAEQNGKESDKFAKAGVQMSVDRSIIDFYSNMDHGDGPPPTEHLILRGGRYRLRLETNSSPRRFSLRRLNEEKPSLFGLYEISASTVSLCVSQGGYPHAMASSGSGSGDLAVFRRVPLEPPVWDPSEAGGLSEAATPSSVNPSSDVNESND